MDSVPDSGPYQLVSYQKQSKKPRMDPTEQKDCDNQTETPICIVFHTPKKSGTEINVSANVKWLFTTMMKADPTIKVLSLDRQSSLHLTNDEFPSNNT